MPRELVEAEVKVEVVVRRVEPGLVLGVALAPALAPVVRQAMALPMLLVTAGAVVKVLVLMGLAEKEVEMAVVKHMVRVA